MNNNQHLMNIWFNLVFIVLHMYNCYLTYIKEWLSLKYFDNKTVYNVKYMLLIAFICYKSFKFVLLSCFGMWVIRMHWAHEILTFSQRSSQALIMIFRFHCTIWMPTTFRPQRVAITFFTQKWHENVPTHQVHVIRIIVVCIVIRWSHR